VGNGKAGVVNSVDSVGIPLSLGMFQRVCSGRLQRMHSIESKSTFLLPDHGGWLGTGGRAGAREKTVGCCTGNNGSINGVIIPSLLVVPREG